MPLMVLPFLLVENHRIAGRASGADDPQGRPDECAFEDLLVDERLGVDILEVPDAATSLQLGVAGDGVVGTLLTRRLSVVAHGQRDVARGHVLAGADSKAGLALVEEIARRLALIRVQGLVAVIAPAVPLSGV